MRYYAGKALPGSEERTFELDYREIDVALGENVNVGTFNVDLMESPDLGPPDAESEHYQFWRCAVFTAGMIERDEDGIGGWILRVKGEDLPPHFIEILANVHIRTRLKKTNWPDFPIEVSVGD